MTELITTTLAVHAPTGTPYQAPTGADAQLVLAIERELDNLTSMIRADNLHTVIAERIIRMVRQHDQKL